MAPDVSPWVSARAGLGAGFEGGLTATSRAVRVDARHAFESEHFALSLGLGASAILAARPTGEDATSVYGGGLDLPVLLGWRSRADLYAVWLGPRLGVDFLTGQLDPGEGDTQPRVNGHHLHGGGVVGFRAGMRRLYGVLEVEVAYHHAEGTFGARSLTLGGWFATPAAALAVSF
ncbi:MAG: hypothetical protein R3F14_09470 [Polyangiaceae bacterium]